ncbi:MAG: hypothetical protein AB7F23_07545 [Phycisphaerae bacterium]
MELLIENGFDGMAEVIKILLNEAMKRISERRERNVAPAIDRIITLRALRGLVVN